MPRTPANQTPDPTPEPEPTPVRAAAEPAAADPVVYLPAPSILDRVRANQMGPLAAALVVGGLVGLLLSMLVPNPSNVWALMLLATLVAAAVGFAVRYLSFTRDWRAWVPAFLGTVLGVHVMAVTGTISGISFDNLPDMLKLNGPGFDDALLGAFVTPAVSMGTILAGLVAVIVTGWGPRDEA
ncbi:hypothetical protein [Demequina sp.]|uniref:hypothetical protein n=1 Tax=Demequina sp. TaxID=2050685 RepID=UPI003D0BA002